MTSAEGSAPLPHDLADLDEDAAPQVRRFLESIARSKGPARQGPRAVDAAQAPARIVDRERQVMRFAWTCEELNVALRTMDAADPEVRQLLIDHGVAVTLSEIQSQAAALVDAIERATPPPAA